MNNQTMLSGAKEVLMEATRGDNLTVDDFNGHSFINNPDARKFSESYSQVRQLHDKTAKLEEQHLATQNKIRVLESSLSDALSRITAAEERDAIVDQMRRRYLATFKRNKLKQQLDATERLDIQWGNSTAHDGNVFLDGRLYEGTSARRDRGLFEILYGIDPGAVRWLNYHPTVSLLNTHATYISSAFHEVTDTFEELFQIFAKELKKNDFQGDYLSDHKSPLSTAYWNFFNCIPKEACDVSAAPT